MFSGRGLKFLRKSAKTKKMFENDHWKSHENENRTKNGHISIKSLGRLQKSVAYERLIQCRTFFWPEAIKNKCLKWTRGWASDKSLHVGPIP